MTYIITEPCGGCLDKGCVAVCPCDVIHEGEVTANGKTIRQLFIDPEECIHCGLCEPECPVDAIYAHDEVPEKWREFIFLNAEFYHQRREEKRKEEKKRG